VGIIYESYSALIKVSGYGLEGPGSFSGSGRKFSLSHYVRDPLGLLSNGYVGLLIDV
jgi:hypothetical protein